MSMTLKNVNVLSSIHLYSVLPRMMADLSSSPSPSLLHPEHMLEARTHRHWQHRSPHLHLAFRVGLKLVPEISG